MLLLELYGVTRLCGSSTSADPYNLSQEAFGLVVGAAICRPQSARGNSSYICMGEHERGESPYPCMGEHERGGYAPSC